MRAYPRTSGATALLVNALGQTEGLSPHERGNQSLLKNDNLEVGPIPARAGQPAASAVERPGLGAYPRTSGATPTISQGQWCAGGLSPHERGNPLRSACSAPRRRPIPARAGQPLCGHAHAWHIRAYPRTSGATIFECRCEGQAEGLSPHERGNLARADVLNCSIGPIPARAGQPW